MSYADPGITKQLGNFKLFKTSGSGQFSSNANVDSFSDNFWKLKISHVLHREMKWKSGVKGNLLTKM